MGVAQHVQLKQGVPVVIRTQAQAPVDRINDFTTLVFSPATRTDVGRVAQEGSTSALPAAKRRARDAARIRSARSKTRHEKSLAEPRADRALADGRAPMRGCPSTVILRVASSCEAPRMAFASTWMHPLVSRLRERSAFLVCKSFSGRRARKRVGGCARPLRELRRDSLVATMLRAYAAGDDKSFLHARSTTQLDR